MVVEGDTLLHLLVRNDAHKDTVEACLRGGADVGAVNARGEQVLGLARKAAARSGQRRHHGPGASEEARERRLHAEGVVVVIEKYNARRNTSGRKRARRRARLGPGGARSPRSPSSSRGRRRRSASPIRPRTAPEVNASREVDAWRRVAARAHTAADAIEARFRDAWTHEDAEKAARTAQNDDVVVAAVRGAVAEALTARGEDDAVPERATARLDRDLEHVKAERDVARARFNKVKKAYDEIVEERRKREEQIETRSGPTHEPPGARERDDRAVGAAEARARTERRARLELMTLHAQLKGAASYHKQQHEKAADVIDKLRNENNKWSEWYKPAWKSNLRRVRAESPRRPPRHLHDICSMAWRCRFLTARRRAPDTLVDFHTGTSKRATRSSASAGRRSRTRSTRRELGLRAVLDKASAVEARNLRREQELDAREKALTSTLAPSELSDEQRWGARCGRSLCMLPRRMP